MPNCLRGTSLYPLLTYCIEENECCSNDAKVVFNNMIGSAKNKIENTFGCLKPKWVLLTRNVYSNLENVPDLIYACFILKNLCEQTKSPEKQNE